MERTAGRLSRLLSNLAQGRRERRLGAVVRDLWEQHFYVIRYRWFMGAIPEPLGPQDGQGWRLLSPGETEAWVKGHRERDPSHQKMYDVALENKHFLFAAFDGDTVVGRLWLGRDWTYFPSPQFLMVRFPSDMAYSYDHFVAREYRRRGIGGAGYLYRLQTARGLGFRRISAAMLKTNRVGQRNWMGLRIPCWDALQVVIAGRAYYVEGRPWRRLGATVVAEG